MENLFAHSDKKTILKTKTGVKVVPNENRVTVAAISTRGKLKIGVARCSKDDVFDKDKGRQIALKRAKNSPVFTITVPNKVKNAAIFYNIVDGIIETIKNNPALISLQK